MKEESSNVVHVDFVRQCIITSEEERAPLPSARPDDPLASAKLEAFRKWVSDSEVGLQINAALPSVKLPAEYKSIPNLILKFSHGYKLPVLEYDLRGVRAILSFKGVNHYCDIPWESIYIIINLQTEEYISFSGPPDAV